MFSDKVGKNLIIYDAEEAVVRLGFEVAVSTILKSLGFSQVYTPHIHAKFEDILKGNLGIRPFENPTELPKEPLP